MSALAVHRELIAWAAELGQALQRLEQLRKFKRRGARRRPGLAGSAARLEVALLASFERLERDAVASLRGRADDVASGRLFAADEAAELAAARYRFDLSEEDAAAPVDRAREAAVLALLLLWRRRHEAIADAEIARVFGVGRAEVLRRLKVDHALSTPETRALEGQVLGRYEDDLDRLQEGLTEGTPRAVGLRRIVEEASSVGAAAVLVRRLFDEEQFRVQLFSESAVWVAWLQGWRAGAVDGSAARVAAGEAAPEFEVAGPLDERTCSVCTDLVGLRVQATTTEELFLLEDRCLFGRSCRHFWIVVRGG